MTRREVNATLLAGAALPDGVWLYDPGQHALHLHLATDIRAQTGLQDFVATAPLNVTFAQTVGYPQT